MATTSLVRSWRNVAAAPPKKFVDILIDYQTPADWRTIPQVEFMLQSIAPLRAKIFNKYYDEWAPYLLSTWGQQAGTFAVYLFEDSTLRDMKETQGSGYARLKSDLEWISDQLNCNIVTYIGHMEQCKKYINDVYLEQVKKQSVYSIFPTIFLIVACYSAEIAENLNKDPNYEFLRKRKVGFFGFEELMHVYEGELYSCEEHLHSNVDYVCDYDGVKEDLERLLEGDKTPDQFLENPPDITNPFLQCVEAKMKRLYKEFIENLEKRKCRKYTKEILAEKFRKFATTGDIRYLTKKTTTIVPSEGILCLESGNCEIVKSAINNSVAREFNERGKTRVLYRKFESILTEKTPESVDKLFKQIQDLKGEDQSIFSYKYSEYDDPLLLYIFTESFQSTEHSLFKILKFIITKYGKKIDYTISTHNFNNNILHLIRSKETLLTEKEQYYLYKLIYEQIPPETRETVFFAYNKIRELPFFLSDKPNFLIFSFYIEKFPEKLKTVAFYINTIYHNNTYLVGNLLHAALLFPIYNEESLQLECVKGLLYNGVDPNEKLQVVQIAYTFHGEKESLEMTPLQMYFFLYRPPYLPELLAVCMKYGAQNEKAFLSKSLELWTKLTKSRSAYDKYIYYVREIIEYVDEYLMNTNPENDFYNQSGGLRNYNWYPSNNNNNNRMNALGAIIESIPADTRNNFKLEVELHTVYFYKLFPEVKKNIQVFLYDSPMKIAKQAIVTITEALRMRRAYGKHGKKIRMTRRSNKVNYNKTVRNRLSAVNFNMNANKIINELVGSLLELAKKPQFTKQEKALYKKRPIEILKSEDLNAKSKYERLKSLESEMQEILSTR